MKQIKYIMTCLLLAGFLGSCEDFLSVESPDQLTSDAFWRDKADAEAALAAAYSKLEASTNTWSFPEIKWPVEAFREDLYNMGADALNYDNWVELYNFSYTNGNSQFTAYWRDNYRGLNYCNQVLAKVPEISEENISAEDRELIINEAYFLRGYYHLKLLLNWEQIVIRDEYITNTNQLDKGLSGRSDAWDVIINDFTKATALPATRTSATMGRATSGAAYAFLGWAHLTRAYEEPEIKQQQLTAALTAFDKVQGYRLVDRLNSMFDGTDEYSDESIFALQFTLNDASGAFYRFMLHRFIGVTELGGWDEILPNSRLMEEYMKEGEIATTGRYDSRLFESVFYECDYFNDPIAKRVYGATYSDRFNNKIYDDNDNQIGIDYYNKPSFRKYMPADPDGLNRDYFSPNIVLMRYANVLLMKAEALNELGRPAEAIPLINQVRARADMPPMTGTTQEQVRAQIEHERIIEFPLENLRFYDLRRWGKTKEALHAIGRTRFDPAKHNFFPIPLQEINANQALNRLTTEEEE